MERNTAESSKVVEIARTETAPRTLRELGIPSGLAADFEWAFRMLGATRGDRVVGFSFVDTAGARHAIKTESKASAAFDRAA